MFNCEDENLFRKSVLNILESISCIVFMSQWPISEISKKGKIYVRLYGLKNIFDGWL